jgi:hypothetical protein
MRRSVRTILGEVDAQSSRRRLAAFSFTSTLANTAGEILITHAKAQASNVTPGDAPGYPVTISIPGAFQLDSNLFVSSNKIGIQVTSKNVTIDLNGYTLQGSGVAWYGIAGGVNNVTIRNGTIDSFLYDGINSSGLEWIVEDMRVVENARDGIVCAGHARIRNNSVSRNARYGIKCSNGLLRAT